MPRRPRNAPAGYVYHVLNRGVGRMTLFEDADDYAAFERVLVEAGARFPKVELLAYCLMPNHWHLVVRPRAAGMLSEYMRWVTVTHTQRWHAHHQSSGTGPVYQGRFKSFPVQVERHFLTLVRYVERNPLRAELVNPRKPRNPRKGRAQDWRWSSLSARRRGADDPVRALLCDWPVDGGAPADWLRRVNRPQRAAELKAVRTSVARDRPLGEDAWVRRTAARQGLKSTLRPRGRPRKRRA